MYTDIHYTSCVHMKHEHEPRTTNSQSSPVLACCQSHHPPRTHPCITAHYTHSTTTTPDESPARVREPHASAHLTHQLTPTARISCKDVYGGGQEGAHSWARRVLTLRLSRGLSRASIAPSSSLSRLVTALASAASTPAAAAPAPAGAATTATSFTSAAAAGGGGIRSVTVTRYVI